MERKILVCRTASQSGEPRVNVDAGGLFSWDLTEMEAFKLGIELLAASSVPEWLGKISGESGAQFRREIGDVLRMMLLEVDPSQLRAEEGSAEPKASTKPITCAECGVVLRDQVCSDGEPCWHDGPTLLCAKCFHERHPEGV